MQDEYERSALHLTSSTFVLAREAALNLIALYDRAGVSLSPLCSLGRLIHDAISLADAWVAGNIVDGSDPVPLIRGQHLDKIAWAALPLAHVENNKEHLLALKRGCLNPLARKRSIAKDKLWELELWTALNSHGIRAELAEPDIIASTPTGHIAIACKRVYSLANAANSMSKGVAQIKNTGLTGILAVNIDDAVIPPGGLLLAPSIAEASEKLNDLNCKFLSTYHDELSRYVSSGRSSAVMASTCSPLYLEDEGIRECRQMQFWVHPNLDAAKAKHIREFESALFGAIGSH